MESKLESEIIQTLKNRIKFSKRIWPKIKVQTLKDLGITPKLLNKEFKQAILEVTPVGCNDPSRARLGFILLTGKTGSRCLALRKEYR